MTVPSPEGVMRQIKRLTAVHEAAHAVVGHEIGWEVVSIEMSDMDFDNQNPDHWAVTRYSVSPSRKHDIESVAKILAGHVAERLFARDLTTESDDNEEDPEDFVCLADDVSDYIREYGTAKTAEVTSPPPGICSISTSTSRLPTTSTADQSVRRRSPGRSCVSAGWCSHCGTRSSGWPSKSMPSGRGNVWMRLGSCLRWSHSLASLAHTDAPSPFASRSGQRDTTGTDTTWGNPRSCHPPRLWS